MPVYVFVISFLVVLSIIILSGTAAPMAAATCNAWPLWLIAAGVALIVYGKNKEKK